MSLSNRDYGITVEYDVMVPMRDGVVLATDIYYPATNDKRLEGVFPTILGRTSYDKNWKFLWIDPVIPKI